ncbi:hypothetical protein ACOSQ4_001703 [Xanthoceras sorbifolium]
MLFQQWFLRRGPQLSQILVERGLMRKFDFAIRLRRVGNRLFQRCKDVKMRPPNAGWFKINTDAGMDVLNGRTRIGVIIRYSRGFVMASCVQDLDSLFSPLIVKAITILRDFKLAIKTGLVPTWL